MATVVRANSAGTTRDEFNNWPLQPFEDMESSLCVQQQIQQLLFHKHKAVERVLKLPPSTDELVWQYEHIRIIILQLNQLMACLASVCTKTTCPEMESDGQRFLCAAHTPPLECCAVDYCCHTLDKATQFVHNVTLFPGRIDVPKKSAEQFASQVRRLYRILLHCYHAHNKVFAAFEEETYLCKRFQVFAKRYSLLDDETLGQIPIEAGEDEDSSEGEGEEKKEDDDDDDDDGEGEGEEEEDESKSSSLSASEEDAE